MDFMREAIKEPVPAVAMSTIPTSIARLSRHYSIIPDTHPAEVNNGRKHHSIAAVKIMQSTPLHPADGRVSAPEDVEESNGAAGVGVSEEEGFVVMKAAGKSEGEIQGRRRRRLCWFFGRGGNFVFPAAAANGNVSEGSALGPVSPAALAEVSGLREAVVVVVAEFCVEGIAPGASQRFFLRMGGLWARLRLLR
ncbi:hypothetical protein KSP40_PGU006459 [Platanthera guangdongensis]|uniref:Uncharacterized protein n=1 Tax=Platanthera guangdongensis TaxID=2320717 RepID=A0ABR2LVH9_9ASPA